MLQNKPALLTVVVLMAFCLVLPTAQAEVQNIKLSGDVTVRGLYRESLTLGGNQDNDTFNGSIFNPVDDDQRFFMSQVRLNVDADVSENISAQLQLINQRDWDGPVTGTSGSALAQGTLVGPLAVSGRSVAANDQFDVLLNLANITIKELYYPELSMTIGRQNLHWGEGFVLSQGQVRNPDPSGSLTADEFTQFNSFDAISFDWSRDDWHWNLIYAKIAENAINRGDDQDIFGLNIGKSFDSYNAEAEMYFLMDRDGSGGNVLGDTFTTTEELYNIGIRGSIRPFERLKLNGELVHQWGEEGGAGTTARAQFTPNGFNQQNISAWAFDLRAEYDVLELMWPTKFGAGWVFFSGEEDSEGGKSGAYRPNYRGKFYSALREFQGFFYLTDVGITPGYTNQHQIMFDAAFNPFGRQDMTFFTRYLMFWLDEIPIGGRGRHIGNELDFVLNYDYTEDLTFKFVSAFFFPGDYFSTDALHINEVGQGVTGSSETAKELFAEAVLTF